MEFSLMLLAIAAILVSFIGGGVVCSFLLPPWANFLIGFITGTIAMFLMIIRDNMVRRKNHE